MIVYFASNSADIGLDDDEQIQAATAYLFDDPTFRAVIEGRSDDVGSSSSDETSSSRRAEAIKLRLVQQYTIDPGKTEIMAHGSWLMAHGSWLMAHGSWLMAHGLWREQASIG